MNLLKKKLIKLFKLNKLKKKAENKLLKEKKILLQNRNCFLQILLIKFRKQLIKIKKIKI